MYDMCIHGWMDGWMDGVYILDYRHKYANYDYRHKYADYDYRHKYANGL